jgi:hypothetical protein
MRANAATALGTHLTEGDRTMTDTLTDQAPAATPDPVCVACVGEGTDPATGLPCLRRRGTGTDPDPAAPAGIVPFGGAA